MKCKGYVIDTECKHWGATKQKNIVSGANASTPDGTKCVQVEMRETLHAVDSIVMRSKIV